MWHPTPVTDTQDRTYDAVLWWWEEVTGPGTAAQTSDITARVAFACDAGLHVAVFATAPADAVDRTLRARPAGPGTLHVLGGGGVDVLACGQAGVRRPADPPPPDAPDTVVAGGRWIAAQLAGRGIGGALVVVAGDRLARLTADGAITRAGLGRAAVVAPRSLCAVIDTQLRRRAERRVPAFDPDPGWTITRRVPDHRADAHVQATLFTLADGHVGTRGCLEEQAPGAATTLVAAGVYTDHDDRRTLLPGACWTAVDEVDASAGNRVLDLRTGVLARIADTGGFRSLRFASAVRPGVVGLRAEAATALEPGDPLRGTAPRATTVRSGPDGVVTATASALSARGGAIISAARQVTKRRGVERLAVHIADPVRPPRVRDARQQLDATAAVGFDALLAEHRAAWAERWADAGVTIEGDPDTQLAVRFALFHLLSTVSDGAEAAVGARGLSGSAYDGHVFWDADVFVLPALAATRPRAARAMLAYRLARVDAARRRAEAHGARGAFWPWESTDDGTDVTPATARDRNGVVVPILTGTAEQHIVADVAWAAVHYAQWSGDDGFLRGAGAPLVTEGARFWASRVDRDSAGRAHIRNVIGPDEYHECVDDNAYTNVMARWNLRAAAALADDTGIADRDEVARWREIADALVDGYDPATGVYEQFTGFADLTPLRITDIAQPPVAADLLLGHDVVRASQVVKQADVLMLHHLVPDEVAPASLRANLAHYAPRTAHGSSLSPAIHAAVWARAGRPDRALDMLRIALHLDLDDLTGTTAGGLHIATMGGVWQALTFGFLGLRPVRDGLTLDPCLPATWTAVEVTVRFRGGRVTVRAGHRDAEITCERPLTVRLGPTRRAIPVTPPGGHLPLHSRDAAAAP
jgi:trehalose/maltose hydrolase-like predicted phosphorylase